MFISTWKNENTLDNCWYPFEFTKNYKQLNSYGKTKKSAGFNYIDSLTAKYLNGIHDNPSGEKGYIKKNRCDIRVRWISKKRDGRIWGH